MFVYSFDHLVDIKSHEAGSNVKPFRALQPASVDAYANTLVRLMLYIHRQRKAPMRGVPPLTNDVAHASCPQDILQALLRPQSTDRTSDAIQWFLRLFGFTGSSVFDLVSVHKAAVHLQYAAR